MALRRSLLSVGLLLLATGCANQGGKSASTAAPALPAYRSPQDIRPSGAAFEPTPAPAIAAAPSTVSPKLSQLGGDWTPPVKPRNWRYIVIHHSASPAGNAMVFDREHKENGWDELGYDFVIDNGRGGPDGRIEVGPRWLKQKWGAHAKTPDNRFNDFGVGICFVGNFQTMQPTAKQMESAEKLVAWLMAKYDIPASNVIGHEDTGKQTLCPGKNLSVALIRSTANRELVNAGIRVEDSRLAAAPANRELLTSVHTR